MDKTSKLDNTCMRMYLTYKYNCRVVREYNKCNMQNITDMTLEELHVYSTQVRTLLIRSQRCAKQRQSFMKKCIPEELHDENHKREIKKAEGFCETCDKILIEIEELASKLIKEIEINNAEKSPPFKQNHRPIRNKPVKRVLAMSENIEEIINKTAEAEQEEYIKLTDFLYNAIVYPSKDNPLIGRFTSKSYTKEDVESVDRIEITDACIAEMRGLYKSGIENFPLTRVLADMKRLLKDNKWGSSGLVEMILECKHVFGSVLTLMNIMNMRAKGYIARTIILYALLRDNDLETAKTLLTCKPNQISSIYEGVKDSLSLEARYLAMSFYEELRDMPLYSHNITRMDIQNVKRFFKKYLNGFTPPEHIVKCIYLVFRFLDAKLFESIDGLPNNIEHKLFNDNVYGKTIPYQFGVHTIFLIERIVSLLTNKQSFLRSYNQ